MIKFELINSKNYFSTKQLRKLALSILLLFIALAGRNGNGILFKMGIVEKYGNYFSICMFILGSYVLLSYWYSRKSESLGKLEFTQDSIKVTTGTEERAFNFDELTGFKIIHNTYVGEDYESNPMNNYSGDNWLEIKCGNKFYKYEFKIDSLYKNTQLSRLVDQLEHHYEKFEYEQK